MLNVLVDIIRLMLGGLVLLLLLYVPGAVALNCLASRRPAPHLFSGNVEWLFAAVLTSALLTGGIGFVLAEMGLFRWWGLAAVVLLVCLSAALLAQIPRKVRSYIGLVNVPAPYPQRATDHRIEMRQRAALIGILIVAAVLFSRPAEMLRGALDSGVYINAGIALGRTGAIFQQDILMRQLDNDSGEVKELLPGLNPDRYTLDRLRMPGFYVYDKQAALVVPQHYFLYPLWIGLMYQLFGIWGALYTTPLLMLLAVCAVYVFAKRALSSNSALLALALLVLCPVTIWFARYPVSEVITCFLAFGAFFAFMRMVQLSEERNSTTEPAPTPDNSDLMQAASTQQSWASMWAVVAGVACGELALARPDFIFFLAPVPFYLMYWRLTRRWRRPYTWFASTLTAMSGIFLIHYFIYSFPYTLDLYHNTIINIRRLWKPLLIALYGGLILLVALDRLHPRLRPYWLRLESAAQRYRWAWAGGIIIAIGVYVVYSYLWAPWQPNIRFDNAGNPLKQVYFTTLESYIGAPVDLGSRYNLLRIGWYLSPPGILIGVAGLMRWIWNRLGAANGLFFACLVVVSYVFIQETYTDARYIYTMRRFVPVVLPALIMGVAWSCQWLWSRFGANRSVMWLRYAGKGLAVAVAVGLALFFAYTNRALVPHIEEEGAVSQLSTLASHFPGKSVVLFSNERDEPYVVATPLQYIFGIETFVLARPYPDINNKVMETVVTRWQKAGYKVWAVMGANGGKLDLPNFDVKEEGSWDYDVPEFEQLYPQKPTNVSRAKLPWGIYSLQPRTVPSQPSGQVKIDIGTSDYKWLVAGFYVQESAKGDASNWRWTGDHAVLRIPWSSESDGSTLQGGQVTLRLRPESPPGAGKSIARTQPVTVTLTMEDEKTPIGQVVLPPGSPFTDYTISVPVGIRKSSSSAGSALMHIRSQTWSPQEAGISYDSRVLGVQVDSVTIFSGPFR